MINGIFWSGMTFEELYFFFMLFGCCERRESAKIAPFIGFGVFFP
jgi:hypothetical protein